MSEPISTYYGLLRRIHELRQPSLYVEIGVHEGHSLAPLVSAIETCSAWLV